MRALGVNKATKKRWFALSNGTFAWWMPEEKGEQPSGTIEVKDIVELHAYGHGEDLYKLTPHLFEIVTSSRTHLFGADSEAVKCKSSFDYCDYYTL